MKLCCLIVASLLSISSATLPNLIELAQANNGSTLVSLVQKAGLTDVLSTQGPFTLIVPTDDAFAKIPADVVANITANIDVLKNILQYHVANGEVFTFDLKTGQTFQSINGHTIRVYSSGSTIAFNQASVLNGDVLQASNGVIYLVDEVLNVPEGTIDQILMNPDYSISEFLELVKAAKLEAVLNRTSGQRYTVFAPSNTAIQSLDPSLLQRIKSSYTMARRIVEYHMHAGTVHQKSLDHTGRLTTLYTGHYINIDVGNDKVPKLNNVATVLQSDIEAEDGVVHVISHVLIPDTFASVVG